MARLLSATEAAERRKIHPRTQERERAAGGGPPYVRVSARRIAYPEDLLDEWLRARTFPHRAAELAAASRSPDTASSADVRTNAAKLAATSRNND